jgi:small conductance mechanosensitive channel
MVAKFLAEVIEASMLKAGVDRTLASFARHLALYGVMTFVCIAALNKLGVETSSFIAVVGAASLAVGLALQGSLANFASGVMLILFQPFKVGDIIDAGGAQGRVEEIQIFNTIIITAEKKRVIVPNSKITSDKITIDQN